jgi:hypothetical protein
MPPRYIAGLCAAFLSAGLTVPRVDQPLNVRLGDLDVMSSPEFRQALADNKVTLVGWRPIQRLSRD